jgi:predicted dehydrogenase
MGIKVGVLGCGMVAEYGHLPAIRYVPGVDLHAVYDPDWNRALAMQKRFGVPHAYPTEKDFFASDIDVVAICSPAPVHHRNVLDAAKHRKHVLCEKPLAMTEPEIEEMIAVMEKAGLHLFTGFTYRFSPSALEIKRLVAERAVGEVRALRLVYIWNLHGRMIRNERGEWVHNRRRTGRMEEGGPMVDCGVHQIDLARWWLDSEIVRSRGIGVWIEDHRAPDHMYLHLDHDNGAHTMVEMSFSYNAASREPRSHFLYELIGTDGVIRYERENNTFEVRNHHGTSYPGWHGEKNFNGMYEELRRAVETGRPGRMPTGRDGLLATRIARAATEEAIADRHPSSRKRSPVPLDSMETFLGVDGADVLTDWDELFDGMPDDDSESAEPAATTGDL